MNSADVSRAIGFTDGPPKLTPAEQITLFHTIFLRRLFLFTTAAIEAVNEFNVIQATEQSEETLSQFLKIFTAISEMLM